MLCAEAEDKMQADSSTLLGVGLGNDVRREGSGVQEA